MPPPPKLCNSCFSYFLNLVTLRLNVYCCDWLSLMPCGKLNIAAFLMSVWYQSNSQKYLNSIITEGGKIHKAHFLPLWISTLVFILLPPPLAFHHTQFMEIIFLLLLKNNSILVLQAWDTLIVFHCPCLRRN